MHHQRLVGTRAWREIPGCPGRQVRSEPDPELDRWVREHAIRFPDAATDDPVLIWLLPGGGAVLSYEKPDGRLVHTLNTDEGLRRKCAALGVDLDGWIRARSAGV